MDGHRSKYWKLFIVALALVLVGSVLASWIQTGAGAATVTEVKFYGMYNGIYDAYLFVPEGVTTGHPAPAVLAVHGYNNSKEYMNNTALELARRGYVVLSMDLDKHGLSGSSKTPSATANAYGAYDGLKYLRSLDIVDPSNVGMIGMSMGGMAIEAAGQMAPDDYQSMFFMDSNCSQCDKDKNFAMSWGTGSEVPQPFGAINGSQVPFTPAAMKTYGTDQPVVPGKVYGSIADGTAKVYYEHFGNHPYSTDDPVSIGNAVRWFGMTLKGAQNASLAPEDQIWPNKNLGTFLAYVGLVLFLIALGALLLGVPYFKSLTEPMPVYKGSTGARWWIFAVITALLGPLTLYQLFLSFFNANYFHMEGITTGFLGWMMVVGLITIVILVGSYYLLGRKEGVTGVNYGLKWADKGIDWGKIGKSALLALAVVVSGYILLFLVNSLLMVDFRFWILTLKVTDYQHFYMLLAYIIPAAIYFIPISVALHGTLRPKNGQATLAQEMLINTAILVIGLGIVLAYFYIPLEFFGAPANFGPGGLGLINAIGMLGLLPVIACISTFFYRKTGHVYVGALINTFFIVWYLVAANAVFSFSG